MFQKTKTRYPLEIFFWLPILLIISILTLALGHIPFTQVWEGMVLRLSNHSDNWNPLLDERLPRLIILFFSGASLATAGAAMQALFQTPLASPTILGTSAGGSIMMSPIILMNWQTSFPMILPLAGFGGSLAALLLVYGLARSNGNLSISKLLLTGLAVSSLLFSIEGALNYAFRTHWSQIQLISELSSGSTANLGWLQVHLLLPLALVGLGGCLYYSWELDLLSLGDDEASSLGVNVKKVRFRLFLCVAILTGGTLAAIGNIAFFGLLVPCALRAVNGTNNRRLIPLCIIWGGIVLCTIDLLLRILNFHALSLGHLSALIGSLLFLGMLIKQR